MAARAPRAPLVAPESTAEDQMREDVWIGAGDLSRLR